jgi:hypothetical protein
MLPFCLAGTGIRRLPALHGEPEFDAIVAEMEASP